jgi:hypothetical protein
MIKKISEMSEAVTGNAKLAAEIVDKKITRRDGVSHRATLTTYLKWGFRI